MTQLKQEITLKIRESAALYDLVRYWALYDSAIAAGIAGQLSLLAWLILFIAICPIALTLLRWENATSKMQVARPTLYVKRSVND